MIFIISGHMITQGMQINEYSQHVQAGLLFFGSGSRVAVNIFLLIATWFMVDSKFNVEKIIKLYSELFFYTFFITFLMLFVEDNISIKMIIRGVMPFFGKALWFISAYISLLMLSPYLKNIFKLEGGGYGI